MTNSLNTTTDQDKNSWQNEYLKTILHTGIAQVTFVKKDGTERTMLCTLMPSELPQKEDTIKPKSPNPDVLSVWDLEKKDWRSFRFDSIIGFHGLSTQA